MKTVRDFLDDATYRRDEVDCFLDPNEPNWATFDQDCGSCMPLG